jgi:hypothetical protein
MMVTAMVTATTMGMAMATTTMAATAMVMATQTASNHNFTIFEQH